MLLAINTAFADADLALVVGEKSFFRTIDAKSKHAENVLKNIDEMCEEAGVVFRNIDSVAVVVGPGSFTGIRIGVAIVKALSCVKNDLKIYPITSLELMAYIYGHTERVHTVLNALSSLYFVATFENGEKVETEKMVDKLDENGKYITLKGDLSLKNAEVVEFSPEKLAEFALLKAQRGENISPSRLEPLYIRPSQAEANLKNAKNV